MAQFQIIKLITDLPILLMGLIDLILVQYFGFFQLPFEILSDFQLFLAVLAVESIDFIEKFVVLLLQFLIIVFASH